MFSRLVRLCKSRPSLIYLFAGVVTLALIGLVVLVEYAELLAGWRTGRLLQDSGMAMDVLAVIISVLVALMTATISTLIVALVLISNQFAPRALQGFLRDPYLHLVLAYLLGAMVLSFALLLRLCLQTKELALPGEGVALAGALMVAAAPLFLHFMWYIANRINVSSIIEQIAGDTLDEIDTACPERWGSPAEEPPPAGDGCQAGSLPINAEKSGYIQSIDLQALEEVLRHPDCPEGLAAYELFFVGQFAQRGAPIVRYTAAGPLPVELARKVAGAFVIHGSRTIEQDIAFGLRQLVDIAIKAISPAVNDPTTTQNCVDYIGVILSELAQRRPPSARIQVEGKAIYMQQFDFARLLRFSFNQVLVYAMGDVTILTRISHTLGQVGSCCTTLHFLDVLEAYIETIVFQGVGDMPAHAQAEVALSRERTYARLQERRAELSRV